LEKKGVPLGGAGGVGLFHGLEKKALPTAAKCDEGENPRVGKKGMAHKKGKKKGTTQPPFLTAHRPNVRKTGKKKTPFRLEGGEEKTSAGGKGTLALARTRREKNADYVPKEGQIPKRKDLPLLTEKRNKKKKKKKKARHQKKKKRGEGKCFQVEGRKHPRTTFFQTNLPGKKRPCWTEWGEKKEGGLVGGGGCQWAFHSFDNWKRTAQGERREALLPRICESGGRGEKNKLTAQMVSKLDLGKRGKKKPFPLLNSKEPPRGEGEGGQSRRKGEKEKVH